MTDSPHTTRPVTSWKEVLVSMAEQLRWPIAVVAVALVFREPLRLLILSLAKALAG